MAIGSAVQRGTFVYIYDEKGRQIGTIPAAGSGPNDGLKGFTANTVSVQRGSFVYMYDERGHQTAVVPAR